MTFSKRLLTWLLAAAGMACAGPAMAIEAWQTAAGYQQMLDALGPNTPLGAGASVSLVESSEGTNGPYVPDKNNTDFAAASDPFGQPVTFIDAHNANGAGFSNHATLVALNIVGATVGLAKGTNTVTSYDANRWLNDFVRFGSTQEPVPHPFDVQNHSWIGTLNSSSSDLATLERFDYLIETGEMNGVVGANNNNTIPNPTFAHPNLMTHSYNAIVVGRTDSRHSRGMTNSVYGPGRFRPDVVSAAGSTSAATGQISSVAAVLRGVVAGTDADRSEPMKAIIMAGATKSEFAAFVEPGTGLLNAWDRLPTRPLDDIFGAGEVNVYNSYLMTVGGRHAGSTAAPTTAAKSYGWDYQNRKGDSAVGNIYYNFVVPAGSTAGEFSVMLNWNVNVTDTNPAPAVFTTTHTLQNLDLALYDSTASFMGSLLDQSVSTVDNVEHIFQTNLVPGTYTLAVSGAAGWDFGLAWRMSTSLNQPSADFDGDTFVTGNDFLIWQQNIGTLVGALHSQGDADGDGDVDRADLAVYTATITPPMGGVASGPASGPSAGGASSGSIRGVPEPATWALAAAAGLWAASYRRGRRTLCD